jgi:hypothetical protein
VVTTIRSLSSNKVDLSKAFPEAQQQSGSDIEPAYEVTEMGEVATNPQGQEVMRTSWTVVKLLLEIMDLKAGGHAAFAPALPGLGTQGKTVKQVIEDIQALFVDMVAAAGGLSKLPLEAFPTMRDPSTCWTRIVHVTIEPPKDAAGQRV